MMHEPIQAKGLTMSEKLMEQYRLRKQRKRRNACIAAIVTVVLVLAVAGGVWWTAGDGSVLVRNMFKPKATPATQPVVDSTAAFAYRTAPEFLAMETGDRDTGNVNYSPASMWMALAIAAQGANGTTRSQLNELLGSGSLADSDYQSLLSSVNGQYSGAKSEMSAANSLWIDNDYSLASDYQSTVKKMFEAEVTTLPFDDQAAAKMSDWIAKHTNGSLKPKITLRDREVLSIINTVYADGRWKDPFEEQSTGDGTFHGEAGDAQVPMMHRTFSQMTYSHDEYNTWQRVEIPFDNSGNLAIVLPAEGHFDELAGDAQKLGWAFGTCSSASLGEGAMGCAADSMPGWGVSVNSATVNVSLPRFTIDSMFDSEATIKAFEKLGVTDAFSAGDADFTKMVDTDSHGENLYIGSILQGTRIEVNEAGAKAMSFTKAGADFTSAPVDNIEFTVDRPFLYSYVTPDGIPLFIGAVRNLGGVGGEH